MHVKASSWLLWREKRCHGECADGDGVIGSDKLVRAMSVIVDKSKLYSSKAN